MQFTYSIDQSIFDSIKGYQRGIVLGFDIQNGPSPQTLTNAIQEIEVDLRSKLNISDILQNPHIAAWRDAYRDAGIKPANFRPSVEGLIRRVLRGDSLPSINCIVDIGTYLSIKYLLPIGAHAIDHLNEEMSLRKATGAESFEAFGANIIEKPEPGEFIFTDGNEIMTRRWTWRQARHSIIETSTKAVEFNIDALAHVSNNEIETIAAETIELLGTYCQGNCRSNLLNQKNNTLQFNYP
jgi:DNA/RNA-binding domain of Phe-tRNA-synthetase-like protein